MRRKILVSSFFIFILSFVILIALFFWGGMAGITVKRSSVNNPMSSEHLGIARPLPRDIEELVTASELIVSGRIGEIVRQDIFYGYGPEAESMAELDKETSSSLGVPITDYQVLVDEVILGDSELQEVILRVTVDPESAKNLAEYIFQPGSSKLLFLSQNPDGKTYGIASYMHLMHLNDSHVTYSLFGEDLTPFGARKSPQDFIDEVKQTVEESLEETLESDTDDLLRIED